MKKADEGDAPESEQQETTRKSSVAYAAGLTIFFSVLSFMGVGWALDRWLGTRWLMVTGICLGAAVGLFEFVRIISRIDK
jgi:F0F1-type ATP synthase assembly protein I